MNFSRSVALTTSLMFTFGMACVGTRALCFLYLMELLPKKSQVPMGTVLNIFDAIVPVLGVVYFWKISKDWVWFVVIFAEIAGVLVIIGTFFLPESPKFLISMKRFDQAKAAVNFFAKKGFSFTGKFDREVLNS